MTGQTDTPARARSRLIAAALLATALAAAVLAFAPRPETATPRTTETEFIAVDLFVDSGTTPLAAYQIDFIGTSPAGPVRLVGVEGGDHPAFAEPPYYDPKALATNRVIIAALSTDADLPKGKTRVARLHLEVLERDEPQFAATLITAGDEAATPITGTASARQAQTTPRDEQNEDRRGEP